jgi:uncharacterized DUF497 family protein
MNPNLEIISFEWDEGNRVKNWTKHRVLWQECEDVFFNEPLFILPDVKHSDKEERYHALGHTNRDRLLFMSFTIRKGNIRVISAREMSRKERNIYNEQKEKYPKV